MRKPLLRTPGLPVLGWVRDYQRAWLGGDLAAGFTVGVMLIPQGMAYAMIAGLPPVFGLYAALLPQVAYAVLGSSRQLAVGPVAMDSLLVASGLGALALVGPTDYISAALFLALFVGTIQVLFGLFRGGFLVDFLSRPVISGFTSAAAIIIGFSQLKHVLGIEVSDANRLQVMARETLQHLPDTNLHALSIGVATVGLLLAIQRYGRGIPAALVVVALGTLIVYLTGWASSGLRIVGEIPSGLPAFAVPDFSLELGRELLPTALTLALVGFMEATAIGKALEERDPEAEAIDTNQELVAIGASNVLGSFFGSYPVTGGFSRSAVNEQAGAKTGFAALTSASVIALTLLFLTPLFYYLPNAVLGGIILVAVIKLVDLRYPYRLWRTAREELALLVLTFVLTLTVGIFEGIVAGVFGSLLVLVYRASSPHIAELGRIRGTTYYRNVDRFREDCEVRPDILMFRFDAPLFFANVDYFRKQLYERVGRRGPGLTTVVINAESISYVDSTATYVLTRIITDLKRRGLRVIISGAIGPARDAISSSGLIDVLGREHLFIRTCEAVDYCDGVRAPTAVQRRIVEQVEPWIEPPRQS